MCKYCSLRSYNFVLEFSLHFYLHEFSCDGAMLVNGYNFFEKLYEWVKRSLKRLIYAIYNFQNVICSGSNS